MRILAMAHAYPPVHNAGAEMTLHSMLRHLGTRGHHVHVLLSRPLPGAAVDYQIDGVQVHVYRDVGDPMPFINGDSHVDLVITHLENTLRAAALCDLFKVPLVHLIHNTHGFTKGALRRGPCQLAIFNSEWMREDFEEYWTHSGNGKMPPSMVIHPPVIGDHYRAKHGRKITLINLNEDKGGELFWRLAEAMPEREFLGVKGAYGPQVIPPRKDWPDNVSIHDHVSPRMMARYVYGDTKVLLMPSIYESYGRCAIEAAYSGIPTVAHPTAGLKEALGKTGIFVHRSDLDAWIAAIRYLTSPRGFSSASAQSRAHAESLDPQGDLDRFAHAMEGVVRRGLARIG